MNATADGQDTIRREGIIMKIIGKTDDGFILIASKEDVAGLEGLYTHEKQFKVGDLIDVNGLCSKYRSIDIALDDIDRLKRSAQRIIDNAKWVEEFQNGE